MASRISLNGLKTELDRLKSRSRTWQILLLVAVVILAALLFTVFRSKAAQEDSVQFQVQQMDSTIKYQAKHIQALNALVMAQDTALTRLDRQYKANRPKETVIIRQYEKVPADISSLNREQLRREVADF